MAVFSATFTAFVKPIATELAWSRTQVISGYSVASAALAFAAWPTGMLIDRFSSRHIILLGVPLFGAALASMALIPANYPVYLFICLLVGVAGAGCFHVVYISILAGWFERRFGLAVGIALAGSGIGVGLMPIYAQALISAYGWRAAYIALGLTSVAVAWPSACLLLHHRAPVQASSTDTDTGTDTDTDTEDKLAPGMSRAEALRSIVFWRVFLCYFLIGALVGGFIVNLIPLLTDRGIAPQEAATFAGLFGVSVLFSRLASGYMLDWVDAGRLGASIFLICFFGGLLLTFTTARIPTAAAVLLIGLGAGSEGDIAVFVILRKFGRRAFGALSSIVYSSLLLGVLVGPLVFSLAHDLYGSYRPGQYPLLAGGLLACLLHFSVTGGTWRRQLLDPEQSASSV